MVRSLWAVEEVAPYAIVIRAYYSNRRTARNVLRFYKRRNPDEVYRLTRYVSTRAEGGKRRGK